MVIIKHQSRTAGAFSMEWGCFHVPGERGVPAGGAGEYPALLLDGADHYGSGGWVWIYPGGYR